MRSIVGVSHWPTRNFSTQGPIFSSSEVLRRRHGDHEAAGDVLGEAGDLVGEAGHVLLADVGQQHVDLVVAGRHLDALVGAGEAAREERLVEVRHLDELVLDVAGLGGAVHVGGQRRRRR